MGSTKRHIEAVVFDMDGVLVDSEPIWRAVEREVFARVGIDLTDEDLMRTTGVPIAEVVDIWHRRHPWDEPSRAEVVDEIVEGVAGEIERRRELDPHAHAALDYLEGLGLRLALASSSPPRLIRAVTSLDGLADRFEVIHSAEAEERGKPDPAVYLTTARELRVEPERCLAVEDSLNGVKAAKAAGMVCVAIPESFPEGGDFGDADLVLRSLAELDERVWDATGTAPPTRGPRRGTG